MILDNLCHDMEPCQRMNWCMLLENTRCGQAWSPTTADKALGDDDMVMMIMMIMVMMMMTMMMVITVMMVMMMISDDAVADADGDDRDEREN